MERYRLQMASENPPFGPFLHPVFTRQNIAHCYDYQSFFFAKVSGVYSVLFHPSFSMQIKGPLISGLKVANWLVRPVLPTNRHLPCCFVLYIVCPETCSTWHTRGIQSRQQKDEHQDKVASRISSNHTLRCNDWKWGIVWIFVRICAISINWLLLGYIIMVIN